MEQTLFFAAAGETNRGLVREFNEDDFSLFNDEKVLVATVADGVSCQGHGAVASGLCCQVWHDAAKSSAEKLAQNDHLVDSFLRDTLALANQKVLDHDAKEKIAAETTVCALCLTGNCAGIIHAGDSRVYRLRNGKLQLLTQDHTLAERYFLEHGCFPENREKYASMIYRAVGARPTLEGDVKLETLFPGDRFLLCSDGLYRQMDFDEIEAILQNNDTPRRAVDRLMRAGLIGGADDNLTAVAVYTQKEKF